MAPCDKHIAIVNTSAPYVGRRKLLDDELLRSETDPARVLIHSPNLERGEINKHIRVLRRARDHSYGRDE